MRRLACDATLVVGVDDDVGHTMYEGRARRTPTPAQRREVRRRDRHCRFPGCTNVTFTNTHHVVAWKPGGRTDLDNLALLCVHHHHLVHATGWQMTGNANEELSFVGPSGRVMTHAPLPAVDERHGRFAVGAVEQLARRISRPRRAGAGASCLGAPALGVDPAHLGALRRPGRRPRRLHAETGVELGGQALERQLAVARLGPRLRCAGTHDRAHALEQAGPLARAERWEAPTSNCTSTRLKVRLAC